MRNGQKARLVNLPTLNARMILIVVWNAPALEYSDAALSKSGFHLVKLVFKLQKQKRWGNYGESNRRIGRRLRNEASATLVYSML